ncbi:hypothetical protein [Brevibacillus sp. 179-C9.3 HS]|uniref:hypothetical protein n=1 Tax=unclassified Brevibacillus TaxID=2684853 RepID=UPI0039A0335C
MKKKIILFLLMFSLVFSGGTSIPNFNNDASASSNWENIDHISKGFRIRLDPPVGNGKYHVHVYNKDVEIAVENVDGTASHGQTFDDCMSSKTAKKIRATRLYKKGADLQEEKDKLNEPKKPKKKRK